MQIIRQSEYRSTPWKNGGGITREAIRVPAGGDAFRWRVSVAHIDQPGPFSDFAGYNRIMVLLRGAGVALKFANGERQMLRAPGDVARFDGAIAASCELLGGPCVDLNLMAAKSLTGVHARVERVIRPYALVTSPGNTTLVFPIDAALEVRMGPHEASLEAWDLAVISHSAGQGGTLVPRDVSTAATVFLAVLPEL
jgi:environmental stress-induced protein Ves